MLPHQASIPLLLRELLLKLMWAVVLGSTGMHLGARAASGTVGNQLSPDSPGSPLDPQLVSPGIQIGMMCLQEVGVCEGVEVRRISPFRNTKEVLIHQ